jgi:hypothetical protein
MMTTTMTMTLQRKQLQPRGRTTGKKARQRNLGVDARNEKTKRAAQAMGFGGQQQYDVVANATAGQDQSHV